MSEIITESNQTVSQEDNSTQNDYIIAINKKIRAQKKKCQNIAYIEQRLANKETINSDQKKVIESKDQTVKMLKELESLRNQFVEIYNAEEKKKAEKRASSSFVVPVPAPVPVVTVPDQSVIETKVSEVVRDLIALFHTTQVFDKTRPDGAEARQRLFAEIDGKSQVIKGEDDIDYIYYLLSWLFTNSINNATAIANKFLVGVEEEWDQGVTYKQLKDVVSELVASQTFLSHPVQVNYQQQEQVQPQEAPIQHEEPQQVVAPTEAPVEVKQPQQEEPQKPQEQPQVEENVPEEPQQQDPSKDDDGYTTKEGRFSRGRGRGGRGTRGGGRGSPRGGRYFDGNRGGRGGDRGKDFEHRSPREFNDRPRGGRGSPRGGRDFDGNRGGRGQPQQPKA